LADAMKRMVGYRNVAVRKYQALKMSISVAVIREHPGEFTHYAKEPLLQGGGTSETNRPPG